MSRFLVIALLAFAGPVAATPKEDVADIAGAKETLGGINAFLVNVLITNQTSEGEVAKNAPTKDAVTNLVELALRRNRIRLASEDVDSEPGVNAILSVEIIVLPTGAARWDVFVRQYGRLASGESAFVITWEDGGLLTRSKSQLLAGIRDGLSGTLDALCNQYLDARSRWLAKAATGAKDQ